MPKLGVKDDSGAISTLFAILMGCGLLIAILGMVVDTGQVLVQRQLVRVAADSVADAVAMHCAKENPATTCLTDAYSTGAGALNTETNSAYLNNLANPNGGNVTVTKICGKNSTTTTIPACPALSLASYDCKTNLALLGYTDWIRVYTSSDPAGIKAAFIPFITGSKANYQELGCSQVWWGKASSITVDKTGNQLPILFGNCVVDPTKFGTLVGVHEENDTTVCNLKDYLGAARTSTTHGVYIFNPSAVSTACYTITPPAGSAACPRVYPTNVVAKTATAASAGCDPTSSYPCLISTIKTQVGKKFTLPVVETSGTALVVKGFVNYTLMGYQFPTSSLVNAASAQYYLGGNTAANQATLNGKCPTNNGSSLLPNAATVPCFAGVFSAKTTSGFNAGAGATASTATTILNLGYQMIMHVD